MTDDKLGGVRRAKGTSIFEGSMDPFPGIRFSLVISVRARTSLSEDEDDDEYEDD
jgi:hypothetical protein